MLAPLTRTVRRARGPVHPRRGHRLAAALLITVVALAGCGAAPTLQAGIRIGPPPTEPVVTPSPTPTPSPSPTPTPTPTATATTKKPTTATTKAQPPSAQWQYVSTSSAVFGSSTPLWRYAVAVESGLPVTAADFTGEVNATLSDPRSWIAGGTLSLQQVRPGDSPQFTVYLASPSTAAKLCGTAGIDIRVGGVPYTSCRAGNYVVINSTRYLNAVPNYGASLDVYRQYAINHEVGHRLGHGHERCPASGQPAPVMEQQTLGLQGCVANSWPYLNGSLYSGPPV